MAAPARPIGAKRVAEFTSALAAVVVVVVSALTSAGHPPVGRDYALWFVGAALLVMTFSFGQGFEWVATKWDSRKAATKIRRYPELAVQLAYLAGEIFDATSSRRAKVNTYGYVAFEVQQNMGRAPTEPSKSTAEKAGEINNAWATGDGLREATANTVRTRCASDARESTQAFHQVLEQTQQLAVSAMASVSEFLYCIRRGFPCSTVTAENLDNWASFAGRVNQYQDQLGYLIREANELFGFDLTAYFRPVPPWLWLNVQS